jgi:2-oxoisovalerate dehydrogenase E1 component subunit alpha
MAQENDPLAMATAAAFEIPFTRYLAADGTVERELPEFAHDPANLIPLYRAMVLTRLFDKKAVALQRTGRLGTFASSLGQEAVGVGAASAMRPDDILVPSFREQAAQFWRGVTLKEVFLFWGGDERGSNFAGPREDFPVSIPVASHFPHAAGAALAFKLRGEPRVAVCIAGDGATSKGDFYEALNIAGVWKVPTVFLINDNQWAISVRREAQTAARTLAQKAIAAGMPGEQVDGNDVIAVRDAVSRALERAREGEGPTLIEAVTYRLADHTTADDAHRYRDDAEVSPHWKEEPVARLRDYLVGQKAWGKEDEEALRAECTRQVEEAADAYLATEPEPVADIFDYLYAELPEDLKAQRDFAIAHIDEHPDG